MVTTRLDYCNSLLAGLLQLTLELLQTVQNCTLVWYWISGNEIMLHQLWSNYTGCRSRLVYSLSCAHWCMEFMTVSVRRTCLMWFSRSRLRQQEKDCDRLLPQTMRLRDCGPGLASMRSCTLALLLGINSRKLSARHKHNRTSRDF